VNNYLRGISNPQGIRIENKAMVEAALLTKEPYRREPISLLDKIRVVNDSRSTTLNSAWFALSQCENSVVWIVGNMFSDKYHLRQKYMREQYKKVKALIVLEDGADKPCVWHNIADQVPIIAHATPSRLINTIFFFANKGDTILFSPAAPSFDLFDNYTERGKWFNDQIILHS
jgi:UDP-N-acetylmuramoylalanine--D-glutamate ligase